MTLHEVLTNEKVSITYRVAGLGARFLAWLVDFVFILLLSLVGVMVSMPLDLGREGLGTAVAILWNFVVTWSYFPLFEWLWQGQTPGKRLMGIRVIHWRGTTISFYEALLRNLLRIVDALPVPHPALVGGLGFVVAACNRENRRLGDLAAGTLVVHVEKQPKPIRSLYTLSGADAEAERARQALLRQRLGQLSREQKQTLLDLCLRRDQLRLGERARLFRATAEFFQTRLELAPDAYESEEKFVLQLAAVLGERGPAELEAARGMKPAGRK
jgi:uncharacterized RDD family membrane protein YckC